MDIDTSNPYGFMYAGAVYDNFGYYERAAKYLNIAFKLSPKDSLVNYYLGNLYFDEQNYMEAVNYYSKAADYNPGFNRMFMKRGSAYYNLGFFRLAVEDWTKAVKIEPERYYQIKPLMDDAKNKAGTKY